MLNETVNTQEAIIRLQNEVGLEVMRECESLMMKELSAVPHEILIGNLLEYVHRADVIVHHTEIEAAVFAQSIGFNSDP